MERIFEFALTGFWNFLLVSIVLISILKIIGEVLLKIVAIITLGKIGVSEIKEIASNKDIKPKKSFKEMVNEAATKVVSKNKNHE